DQTTAPFIEKRGHRRKPLPDGFDIDHHYNIWYPNQVVNPYITLSKVDSIISGRALSAERPRVKTVVGQAASPVSRRWRGRRHLCHYIDCHGRWRPINPSTSSRTRAAQ